MRSRRFSSDRQLLAVEAGSIVLTNGSLGTGVGQIQLFLMLIGNRLPKSIIQGRADGVFGAETASFVKRFQSESGLKVDAIVGPRTLAAMDAVLSEKRFLDSASPAEYSAAVLGKSGLPLGRRPAHFD